LSELLRLQGLGKDYSLARHWFAKRRKLTALDNLDLTLYKGEALCVVGESGSGKSTLAKLIMGLERPSRGQIFYSGQRIDLLNDRARLPFRQRMQMVFQNPYASLNPRVKLFEALEEPVRVHNPGMALEDVGDKVLSVMAAVVLDPAWAGYYPHAFSGGQRQRISIARALVMDPELIVADEPLAALDVSIQAQVLNLLRDLQRQRDLTFVFISHDLAVVEHFATRVAVIYRGVLCELATTEQLFSQPRHPYTRALLSAVPIADPEVTKREIVLEGNLPSALNPPQGCPFSTRCPRKVGTVCDDERPPVQMASDTHAIACHIPLEELARVEPVIVVPSEEERAHVAHQ